MLSKICLERSEGQWQKVSSNGSRKQLLYEHRCIVDQKWSEQAGILSDCMVARGWLSTYQRDAGRV
jgi:formylmethanofuran dehydrogenase subunit E-like metal-binding protein